MARVERYCEQAALLPFEMHFAFLFAGGPDLGRADALDDVDQLFIEMMFRIERAARRNLTDVHAGKTFHAFEIDVGTLAAGALPSFERQLGDILDAVTFEDWNPLFLEPHFVAGFSLRHDQCPLTSLC